MALLLAAGVTGCELKTAGGTGLFILTVAARTGFGSHFAIGGAPQWRPFFLCIIFTFGFAQLAARIANRASAKTLNRATGVILVILGVVILGFSLLE